MNNLFESTKAQSRSQAQANIETRDGKVKRVYTSGGNSTGADVLLDGETNILRRVPNAGGGQLSPGLKVKVNFSKGSRFDAQIIGGGDGSSGSLAASSQLGTNSSTSTAAPPDLTQNPLLLWTGDEALTMAQALKNGTNIQEAIIAGSGTGDTFVPTYLALSSVDALLSALPSPTAATLPDGLTPMTDGLRVEIKGSGSSSDALYRLDKSVTPTVWRQIGGGGFTPAAPVASTGIVIISILYVGQLMNVTFGATKYGADTSLSAQIYQWQYSIDAGKSWKGNDGTANTTFPGSDLYPAAGISAGTIRARVRAVNALGVASDWTTMSADVAYAAPTNTFQMITLAATTATFVTAGRNYTMTADFSAVGVFGDADFVPRLFSTDKSIVIAPNYNLWKPGVAGWTIYIPTGYPNKTATFNCEIKGENWTGSVLTNVATTWTNPVLIA